MSDANFLDLSGEHSSSCFLEALYLLSLPFLIFAAVIAGYFDLIAFKVEIHSIILIGAIFVIYLFLLKHNASYAACKFSQDIDAFKKELRIYINSNPLSIGGIEKANAPYDSFAKDYTAGLRNENFASIAAGIFPTLGILGTFISIAISMPDFSSNTSAVLEREISLLLGGVGTAFYVSIYGIFLSIWWILFDKSGISKFENRINALKKVTKSLFWSKEEIEQTYFQKSMENFERLNSVFDNFAKDELIEKMNQTITQRIEMFSNIIELEQEAITRASKQLQESQEATQNAQKTQIQISEQFATMLEQSKESAKALASSATLLQQIAQTLCSKEENLSHVAKALGALDATNVEKIHASIVKNFETMKQDTDKIGWSFNAYLNDFDDKFAQQLGQTLQTIDSEVAKIVNSLAQVKKLENF